MEKQEKVMVMTNEQSERLEALVKLEAYVEILITLFEGGEVNVETIIEKLKTLTTSTKAK